MKIIHFADLHLGYENYGHFNPATGLSTRLLDFLKVFDEVVDFALKNKVEAVLFAGDAYKTRDPSPTQQREFAKRLITLSQAKIPVILVVGNHDTPNVETKANTLDIYSTLRVENIYVIRRPELITIPVAESKLQIIGIPWLAKSEYAGLGEKLRSLYDKLNPDIPAVLVAHASVEGAVYGSEKNVSLGTDFILPISLLQEPKLSYVALGHLHKRQILAKNPPVVYSGSLERVDFGEEKEDKGFELVEISGGKTSHRQARVSARPFKTFSFDFTDQNTSPTEEILAEIQKNNIENAVVRVLINTPLDLVEKIRTEEIKKALGKANFLAAIQKNISQNKRARLSQTNAEELTTIDALTAYLKAKQYTQEKIEKIVRVAEKIIEK